METTCNYRKHTSKNPIQKYFIEHFYKTVFKIIRDISPSTILDAGCGEGFMLEQLKKWGIGRSLVGIDNSKVALALGKKLHPHLTLSQCDIYNLPYEDNSIDLVICNEVLEHLINPADALKEIVRVSKKYCLLSVPHEPYFTIANFVAGKNWSRWGNDDGHINHWTAKEFKNFISNWFDHHRYKLSFPWQISLGYLTNKTKC